MRWTNFLQPNTTASTPSAGPSGTSNSNRGGKGGRSGEGGRGGRGEGGQGARGGRGGRGTRGGANQASRSVESGSRAPTGQRGVPVAQQDRSLLPDRKTVHHKWSSVITDPAAALAEELRQAGSLSSLAAARGSRTTPQQEGPIDEHHYRGRFVILKKLSDLTCGASFLRFNLFPQLCLLSRYGTTVILLLTLQIS